MTCFWSKMRLQISIKKYTYTNCSTMVPFPLLQTMEQYGRVPCVKPLFDLQQEVSCGRGMVINSNSRGLYYPLQRNWNDELTGHVGSMKPVSEGEWMDPYKMYPRLYTPEKWYGTWKYPLGIGETSTQSTNLWIPARSFQGVYSIVLQKMILENCLKLLRRNKFLQFL